MAWSKHMDVSPHQLPWRWSESAPIFQSEPHILAGKGHSPWASYASSFGVGIRSILSNSSTMTLPFLALKIHRWLTMQVLRCISASGRRKSEKHVRYLPRKTGSVSAWKLVLLEPGFLELLDSKPVNPNKITRPFIQKSSKIKTTKPPNSDYINDANKKKKHSA